MASKKFEYKRNEWEAGNYLNGFLLATDSPLYTQSATDLSVSERTCTYMAHLQNLEEMQSL